MEAICIAPPSRPVSHRYLIGAALAEGESELCNVLDHPDVERTREILAAGGACFTSTGQGGWRVQGVGGVLRGAAQGYPVSCNADESGTTCRLLLAVLASGTGLFRLHGSSRLHERPIGALTSVLGNMGALFRFEEKSGYPPCILEASGLAGGEASIGLEESSQYLSGLLLAAPQAQQAMTITITGRHVVAWSYIGLTLQTLRDFQMHSDVSVRAAEGDWKPVDWRKMQAVCPGRVRFRVRPCAWRAGKYTVDGDWFAASCWLAAGALGKHPVRVAGLRQDSLQGDRVILALLSAMGATIHIENEQEETWPTVVVCPSTLRGVNVDMASCPNLIPVMALLATAARGDTCIRGLGHRPKQNSAASVAELRKAGVDVKEQDDGLFIQGKGKSLPLSKDDIVAFSAHFRHLF